MKTKIALLLFFAVVFGSLCFAETTEEHLGKLEGQIGLYAQSAASGTNPRCPEW